MYILATGEFCGPCKLLKEQLNKAGIEVEYKDSVKDVSFFMDNKIKTIPTLIVDDGSKIIGAGQILSYLSKKE